MLLSKHLKIAKKHETNYNVFLLKAALIQKWLMGLSFLQTDKPNYFPELEFFFHSKWLKSCQIRS